MSFTQQIKSMENINMRKALTALTFVLLSISSAHAQNSDINIAYIIRETPNSTLLKNSLSSMARGLIAANTYSRNVGKELYCQPKIHLTAEQYVDIIKELTYEQPNLLNESASYTAEILILALVKKFPC